MKPKLKHYIPFSGLFSYYNEYYDLACRTTKGETQAMKMMLYHWAIGMIIMIILLSILLNITE